MSGALAEDAGGAAPGASAGDKNLSMTPADPVEHAFAQARARHTPVLVDYHAPWCYSCYYMKQNVLNGAEWDRAQRESTVVELDADSPEGAHWMAQWHVKAMPTYLLFNPDRQELGRILGEQTRGEFYNWLFGLTGRGSTLDALKATAVDGSGPAVAAAREVLRAYHERYDAAGGLGWYASLPPALKSAIARDEKAASWIARLELLRSVAEKDGPGCANVAPMVLSASLGCERPYEIEKVMACTEGMAATRRFELLRPQVEMMQLLIDKRVLSAGPVDNRCADERSIVMTSADLYGMLDSPEAEAKVLEHAIADLKQRIGGDLKKDRNLADNLRVYLERAGRTDELDALLVKLIAVYPDDYVYPFRYAKSLAARGQHAQALPYFERAAAKAYGVNKLRNAEARAKSLQALNRTKDARTVLTAALQDNGPWFPDDAAKLKALLDSLPAA